MPYTRPNKRWLSECEVWQFAQTTETCTRFWKRCKRKHHSVISLWHRSTTIWHVLARFVGRHRTYSCSCNTALWISSLGDQEEMNSLTFSLRACVSYIKTDERAKKSRKNKIGRRKKKTHTHSEGFHAPLIRQHLNIPRHVITFKKQNLKQQIQELLRFTKLKRTRWHYGSSQSVAMASMFAEIFVVCYSVNRLFTLTWLDGRVIDKKNNNAEKQKVRNDNQLYYRVTRYTHQSGYNCVRPMLQKSD